MLERMRTALEILFWLSAALIVWTQVGYAAALAIAARLSGRARTPISTLDGPPSPPSPPPSLLPPSSPPSISSPPLPLPLSSSLPSLSLIVAAHDEQASIAAKVANALALDYPRERLEVIVACDGCSDATAEHARAAGADIVLELPRAGKVRTQDAAVAQARGEILAFSDANALWEPAALRALAGAFFAEGEGGVGSEGGVGNEPAMRGRKPRAGAPRGERPPVGYACGQVRFVQAASGGAATNQEGVYWRYEMAVRELESRLCSITAGNGAIYATRRESYLVVDPIMGHDLSFPFNVVKRGWRAVYVPDARAREPMVPSIEGELARKRRMMSHTWPIVVRGGMLSPRGYPPRYALMILSHRLLRYLTPFLHALALATNIALVASGLGGGLHALYTVTLALQLGLLAAAGLGGVVRVRALLVARYYVLTTAALAFGLWDWLRHGTGATWEAAEGTRPSELPSESAAR
jgi:glycosyltransferase involved in cell wall biosynthesis